MRFDEKMACNNHPYSLCGNKLLGRVIPLANTFLGSAD